MNPVIAMLIGVVVMMVLVICTRMHAFPSLIISAILIAVLSGNYLLVGTGNEGGNLLSVAISTVTGGFGGTMTSIGIVIGFGCIMGIFLEKSGAAKRMAITILKLVGVKRADVVLGLTGFVVSIPVFCDSGFVILSSLAKEFSRLTKKSMVGLGGILGMGLYITHFMVPPTPGPLAVVSTFQNEGINIGPWHVHHRRSAVLHPPVHLLRVPVPLVRQQVSAVRRSLRDRPQQVHRSSAEGSG